MAVPNIAIHGFGRSGRMVTRMANMRRHFDVVAINDLTDPEHLADVFKSDSVHGVSPGDVHLDGHTMVIDNDPLQVLSERDPAKLPWGALGVDDVLDSTGTFLRLHELQHHLDTGARRVIVTVPTRDDLDSTVVLGVNDHVITHDTRIMSNTSCTTNGAAPVALVLHHACGIKRGLLTTVQAFTADQRLVDTPHNNFRRSRPASLNSIPTSTGAARAVGQVISALQGTLDGLALRVPVPDGSVVDLTGEVATPVTVERVNNAMRHAAAGALHGILQYPEEPMVSTDVIGNSHSSIFDPAFTQVMEETFVKVIAWDDNAWGYRARVAALSGRLAAFDGMTSDFHT
jgi:glyceraldehyde 3-phosphate dehydrogenase